MLDPGPILSATNEVTWGENDIRDDSPLMNDLGTSGIMSMEAGGRPGCKARVTGP